MTSVLLGVVAHTDVGAIATTVDRLEPGPGRDIRVVLDRPDTPTLHAVRADASMAVRVVAPVATGPADAFNQLVAQLEPQHAALVVVESGARPGPGAIDALVDAVADARWGIAGPATDDAWNDQRIDLVELGVGLADRRSDASLELLTAALRERYGDEVRPLAPLHSIATVCFAVAGDVVRTIGAADDGFETGPCWEMEYAARAAAVGRPAAWVPRVFVARAPRAPERIRDEQAAFDRSKRRYQQRLCGLRLDGSRQTYADHCRGADCEHFAPTGRIVIRLPVPVARRAAAPEPDRPAPATASWPPPTGPSVGVPTHPSVGSRPARVVVRQPGLVSCIMPTADRPDWVAQSIAMFHRQTLPGRELIVVDDGDDDLAASLGDVLAHSAIHHVRLPQRRSIGAKRNLAIDRSRGDVVVQWDDDDWYGSDRLARQVEPIRSGEADVTGFVDAPWFDVDEWRFRRPTPAVHRHLFVEDVHGGTLAFARAVTDQRGVIYPDTSLAEDACFVRDAVRAGARLRRLPAADSFVYVRHGANTWRIEPDSPGWDACTEPPAMSDDRAFYAARSVAPLPPPGTPTAVSCVMPTGDRPQFVPGAIEAFLAQRHPNCELVVADDGDEPVDHLVPSHPRIRYVRFDRRLPLGEKRNATVEATTGEVVVHFDDDDWSHPDRVTRQVTVLEDSGTTVCGLATMLWWDSVAEAAYRYTCPPLHRTWVAGNTLAYRRSTWEAAPFPPVAVGEDTAFVWGHRSRTVTVIDDERLVIGRIHAANTSSKVLTSTAWSPIDAGVVRRVLDEAGSTWGS